MVKLFSIFCKFNMLKTKYLLKGKMMNKTLISETEQTKIKSKVLDKLILHLQKRTDVQNIDLMNLAGFCRNCLSKWYSETSKIEGIDIDYEQARDMIYGMSYNEWKGKFQKTVSIEQIKSFEKNNKKVD